MRSDPVAQGTNRAVRTCNDEPDLAEQSSGLGPFIRFAHEYYASAGMERQGSLLKYRQISDWMRSQSSTVLRNSLSVVDVSLTGSFRNIIRRVRDLKVRPVPGGIPNNPRICRSAHNSGGR